jgi:SpoVK/Ycf46/Vps4 family AAA+-type ATPase
MMDSNMMTNMIQLKIFSMMNDNIDFSRMFIVGFCYFAYKLFKDYQNEILNYFSLTKKKYVYHLKLIYVLPSSYIPGKIEKNIINEAIFFDLEQNKTKYDVPQYNILSSDFREEMYVYVPDHGRFETISFTFDKSMIYLKNVTSNENDESTSDKKTKERVTFKFELYSYDSMDHLDKYIEVCQENYKAHKISEENKETQIYRHVKENGNDDSEANYSGSLFSTNKSFKNLILDEKPKNKIMNGLENYFTKPEMYEKYGTPHKLGILLYGPPGTGKTSVIKAAIQHARSFNEICHVFDIDLSKLSSKEEANSIFLSNTMRGNIIVLEEFDQANCVKKRKDKVEVKRTTPNKQFDMTKISKMEKDDIIENFKMFQEMGHMGPNNKNDSKLSVEDFLKIFDGIHELTDVIFFATTNHIEDIDPAVLRRFDIKVELQYHSSSLIKQQLELYYDKTVAPVIILPNNIMTGCQIEQICKSCSNLEDAVKDIQKFCLDNS